MIASDTLRPRPLLLAAAAGVLAAAAMYSAVMTPWLALWVREPGEVDWLNASDGFQRFFTIFRSSLMIGAVYGLFPLALTAFAEHKRPRSLLLWLLLGIASVSPIAFLSYGFANWKADCFTNCEPSRLRDLLVVGSAFAAGAAGATVAWLVRHTGRKEAR